MSMKNLELRFGDLTIGLSTVEVKKTQYTESHPKPGIIKRQIGLYNIALSNGLIVDLSDKDIPRKALRSGDTVLTIQRKRACKIFYGPIGEGRETYALTF